MDVSKNNDIDGLITKIDIANVKDIILYLDSENKIVYLGDCSDLNTKILYTKAIVKNEAGIAGEIYAKENNIYFREKV